MRPEFPLTVISPCAWSTFLFLSATFSEAKQYLKLYQLASIHDQFVADLIIAAAVNDCFVHLEAFKTFFATFSPARSLLQKYQHHHDPRPETPRS